MFVSDRERWRHAARRQLAAAKCRSPHWSSHSHRAPGHSAITAAASIGLINSVGGLGGFVGPYFVGYLRTLTGSFSFSLVFMVAALFLSAALVLVLRIKQIVLR